MTYDVLNLHQEKSHAFNSRANSFCIACFICLLSPPASDEFYVADDVPKIAKMQVNCDTNSTVNPGPTEKMFASIIAGLFCHKLYAILNTGPLKSDRNLVFRFQNRRISVFTIFLLVHVCL
jgi:hypothetical protein